MNRSCLLPLRCDPNGYLSDDHGTYPRWRHAIPPGCVCSCSPITELPRFTLVGPGKCQAPAVPGSARCELRCLGEKWRRRDALPPDRHQFGASRSSAKSRRLSVGTLGLFVSQAFVLPRVARRRPRARCGAWPRHRVHPGPVVPGRAGQRGLEAVPDPAQRHCPALPPHLAIDQREVSVRRTAGRRLALAHHQHGAAAILREGFRAARDGGWPPPSPTAADRSWWR